MSLKAYAVIGSSDSAAPKTREYCRVGHSVLATSEECCIHSGHHIVGGESTDWNLY